VIVDEAFLPLVPGGEADSLIPLLADHANLIVNPQPDQAVSRSPGCDWATRYAAPERLKRWPAWRDPWPVNGLGGRRG